MSTEVYVSVLPECDVHKYEKGTDGVPAAYDGATIRGPWANMCEECFSTHGIGLGTGVGQRLIVGEKPEVDRRTLVQEALDSGDPDAIMDAIGDGDIAEWL